MNNPFKALKRLFVKAVNPLHPEISDATKGLIKSLREEKCFWQYESWGLNADEGDYRSGSYSMRFRDGKGNNYRIWIDSKGELDFREFALEYYEKDAVKAVIEEVYITPMVNEFIDNFRKERANKAKFFADKLKS